MSDRVPNEPPQETAYSLRRSRPFSQVVFAVVLSLLFVQAGRAEDRHDGVFDAAEWRAIRRVSVGLGADLGQAEAILLKSRAPKGQSGVGEALFGAGLVVIAGSRVLYRFEPFDRHESFFIDDFLQAKDVSGDGTDEVLFHSGDVGASSSVVIQHVLHLPSGESRFCDVAPQQFRETRRQTFRWVEHAGRTIALVAEPVVPAGTVDPRFCHSCPHFYQYLAFAWRNDRGSFVLVRSIQSERDFTDGTDPLGEDMARIASALSNPDAPDADGGFR